jgi:aminoglycoside phosphotransferase (APT) family kinase protein
MFLKVDGDPRNTAIEVRAIDLAPVPTPTVHWHQPPVLTLSAVPGRALGKLGEPETAPPSAWRAAGTVIRTLHEAPLPPWPGRDLAEIRVELDRECAWLLENEVLPAGLIHHNREIADAALRPCDPAFIHGDLQIAHVFTARDPEPGAEGDAGEDTVTGIIDWSGAAPGDPMYDLATLTLGHEERLDDLLAGYEAASPSAAVDREAIRGWWSLRSLQAARWLIEHGFDPDEPGCEFDVLRARMGEA